MLTSLLRVYALEILGQQKGSAEQDKQASPGAQRGVRRWTYSFPLPFGGGCSCPVFMIRQFTSVQVNVCMEGGLEGHLSYLGFKVFSQTAGVVFVCLLFSFLFTTDLDWDFGIAVHGLKPGILT